MFTQKAIGATAKETQKMNAAFAGNGFAGCIEISACNYNQIILFMGMGPCPASNLMSQS